MIIFILAVLGLIIGSFINALVWRLHEQDTEKGKKKPNLKYLKQLSVTRGRSICPRCKHGLATKDLVPVFSWLSLRGRCRYCKQPISWQYPAVETLTALLFIISYLYWPMAFSGLGMFEFVVWLFLLAGLITLAVYDILWFLLPNRLVYALLGIVLVSLVVELSLYHGGTALLASSFWGSLIGGGIFYVLFQVSAGRWIGGGDVKLGAVLGLLVGGPSQSLLLLFVASLSGSLVSLPLLASGKVRRDTHIPFGPFLIFAAIVVVLFGHSLINWLQNQSILPRY